MSHPANGRCAVACRFTGTSTGTGGFNQIITGTGNFNAYQILLDQTGNYLEDKLHNTWHAMNYLQLAHVDHLHHHIDSISGRVASTGAGGGVGGAAEGDAASPPAKTAKIVSNFCNMTS